MLRKYFQRSLLFHVIIYLSPKCLKSIERGKKTDFFKKKTRIQTMLDKSPCDSIAIFIFFCYFSVPSLNSSAFSKFCCSSPSPTLYKVETRKKFWIHASNIVCGVRGGVGPVLIGKRPRNAKVFQDFCP